MGDPRGKHGLDREEGPEEPSPGPWVHGYSLDPEPFILPSSFCHPIAGMPPPPLPRPHVFSRTLGWAGSRTRSLPQHMGPSGGV